MLCNNFSEKMLGLQDAIVRNVENTDEGVLIQIRMERKAHKCPACGNIYLQSRAIITTARPHK